MSVTVINKIGSFVHCAKCLAEKPKNVSPKEWSRTQFGWTDKGFQIWCNRHDINVQAFDLQGNKVIYDTTGMPIKKENRQ